MYDATGRYETFYVVTFYGDRPIPVASLPMAKRPTATDRQQPRATLGMTTVGQAHGRRGWSGTLPRPEGSVQEECIFQSGFVVVNGRQRSPDLLLLIEGAEFAFKSVVYRQMQLLNINSKP